MSPETIGEHRSRFFLGTIIKNTLTKVNLKVLQFQQRVEKSSKATMNMDDNSHSSASLQGALDVAIREKKETLILVLNV